MVFKQGEIHYLVLGSGVHQHLRDFYSILSEETTPYFEVVVGPRFCFKIYPFLTEIMDERGVKLSYTLHPPGIKEMADGS